MTSDIKTAPPSSSSSHRPALALQIGGMVDHSDSVHSPPPLNYTMHPARKRSLYINIGVISFVNIAVTTIVFYAVKYSGSPTTDPDVYYGAASAVLGVLQIPQWPLRYYQLCRQAGKRGSIAPQQPPSSITSRIWWILRVADCFQWGFFIGIIIGSVMLVLCSSVNSPTGIYPLLVLMPAAILGGIGLAVLTVTLVSDFTKITQPFRCSNVPKGEPIRPSLYYLWCDLVGCDGGGGYEFRTALDRRYKASPPFRTMLKRLSYLIGCSLSSILVVALILTFVLQSAGPDRKYEDASWAANMAVIVIWLCTATFFGLRYSRKALQEEQQWWAQSATSHTELHLESASNFRSPLSYTDEKRQISAVSSL